MALAVSPGVLFVFCYLLNASFADAHSNGLDISVCANFEVTHGGVSAESTKTVQIELLQNGAPVNCFQRQKEYDIKLSSEYLIKGFLLQAKWGASLPKEKNTNLIPLGTAFGLCSQTVSHSRARTAGSPDLIFPIITRKSRRPLIFKYSVVFGLSDFLQKREVSFDYCGDNYTMNTTNFNLINSTLNSTNSTESENSTLVRVPVEGFICGKEVNHIVKQRNHTLNGTDYNCTMNRTLKQTECVPSCVHQNQTVQCNVKTHINRRKGYTCVPHPGQDSSLEMKINFPEVVTSNCQCHYYTTL